MKIELINENQIKCTLNRSDLAYHHIRLSELAYGTEKTRDLFQDMMDQAFNEFGFEASDSLMIEAIPVSMDCIVLMITKVEEPNDLDQGFQGLSNIADLIMHGNDPIEDNTDELDELIDCLSDDHFLENGILENPAPEIQVPPEPGSKAGNTKTPSRPLERIFSFDDLGTVIDFAHKAGAGYKGKSVLYRSPENDRYYLMLVNSTRSVNKFGQVCSLALEYGSKEPTGFARGAYLGEHFDVIIPSNALQKLADV